LLSICIFEILNTAKFAKKITNGGLWIALDLYLWNIEHSKMGLCNFQFLVVNCSRFVSLKYWTQPITGTMNYSFGCELLSICIFEILNTAEITKGMRVRVLWIALDLYLWNIEHSCIFAHRYPKAVVNCSRFVSLKYWTQLSRFDSLLMVCCELLSICIFEILNTAANANNSGKAGLWIALDLYLWNIEHS